MSEPRQRTRLESAHLMADFVNKVLGCVALLVAAWWTYTNFTVERTHDPTMLVTLSPTVHPLPGDRVLLNVDVFMQNIGKVAIKPKFPHRTAEQDLGLEISIVELEPIRGAGGGPPVADPAQPAPAQPPPGATATAAAAADPDIPWFDWTSGDGDPRPILHKRNLLASNEDFRQGRYQLNPGVKYREPFACMVDRDRLYAIRARFWTDEGSVADLVYVDTFGPDAAGRQPAP